MSRDDDESSLAGPRSLASRASRIAAALVMALGTVVLLGWSFGVEEVKRLAPGMVAMNPATALCFVLAGLSVLSLQRGTSERRNQLGKLLAGAVLLVAAAKMFAIASGWDVGVDRWFFSSHLVDAGTGAPNRMAPNTAFNFLLCGAALLLLDVQTRRGTRSSEVLCTISAVSALLAIVGYAYGVRVFYAVAYFIPMALHTALGFVILALAILLARANKGTMSIITSDTAGGVLARRLLPLAIIVPVILGALRLAGERAGLYDSGFGVALFVSATVVIFVGLIWATARLLFRLDIEARAAQEDKSRLGEEVRLLLDSTSEGIYGIDPEGRCTFVNTAGAALLGYEPAELIGRGMQELIHHHPADASAVPLEEGPIYRAGRSGESLHVEDELLWRKDGTSFSARYSSLPIIQGSVRRGAVITFSDITVRKQAAAAVHAAKEEAERANHAKSEFLSRMSHELRTPLNAILGFGQLLESDELQADQQESVGHIVSAGRHLLDLINEVLDISQIESGGMALSMEPVSLPTLLNDVAMLVGPLATERQIRLIDLHDRNGELFVTADRQRLKQVLLNLLANAIKYNRQEGEVRIVVQSGSDSVRIEISDTGIGLPPEKLARMFTPFDRLGAEQTNVEGTGLGLALSKRLVQLMGGIIEVASEAGVGSTFAVELQKAVDPETVIEAESASAETPRVQLPGRTVLYIEDNLSNYRLVQRILQQRPGVKLIAAMQGRLGLDLAREHRPDVVLLDLHLPDIPGQEVLQQIKQQANGLPAPPVIIISADATAGQIERLRNAGADGYLTKPIEVRSFLATLDGILARSA